MTTPESELRQKIFDRIDQAIDTQRWPRLEDLSAYCEVDKSEVKQLLNKMVADKSLGTETGDSGPTYRRPKTYTSVPFKPLPVVYTPSPIDHVKIETQKPLKKPTNAAKYQIHTVEETKAKMRSALVKPMSSTEYGKAVGLPQTSAYRALELYVKNGFLEKIRGSASWKYLYRLKVTPKPAPTAEE